MTTIDTGGPAFPAPNVADGMTLRDYFAAQAMQSFLMHGYGADAPCGTVAGWAYEMADAMLAARNAGQQP